MLPIGYNQTISQPFIVAIMTQMLQVLPGDKILEIGAGCGYQAAIISRIAKEVHTVERIPELVELARENLSGLGYDNVHVHLGDGWNGWRAAGPYDGIIVTAAPEIIPKPLIEQLQTDGTLVIPVGPSHSVQYLETVHKELDGTLTKHCEMAVRFVPLISPHNL
ncbi:protein-L-isoaspartate(D-aspartate) O-methyltransferase [Verrucomicrobiota bacterium]